MALKCACSDEELVNATAAIDVLLNNAGVMPLSPLAALKRDERRMMIDVNIHGVLNGIAAVLPRFVARHVGHVALIGAHRVVPTDTVYCATKYAVWAITGGLRQEHDDIRATIISPGVAATELGNEITDPQAASVAELRYAVIAFGMLSSWRLPKLASKHDVMVFTSVGGLCIRTSGDFQNQREAR